MNRVYFVNGYATAGKDTLVDMLIEEITNRDLQASSMSTIAPVRWLLRDFDLSRKSEADRKLLAVVGLAVEEHSEWRTRMTVAHILKQIGMGTRIQFIFVREADVMRKITKRLAQQTVHQDPINVEVLFVTRPGLATITSNAADADITEEGVSLTIENDGTLDDLHLLTALLADVLIEGIDAEHMGCSFSANDIARGVASAIRTAIVGAGL